MVGNKTYKHRLDLFWNTNLDVIEDQSKFVPNNVKSAERCFEARKAAWNEILRWAKRLS
jgi:hypothetical protein